MWVPAGLPPNLVLIVTITLPDDRVLPLVAEADERETIAEDVMPNVLARAARPGK